jgi:hypothetical protein
MMRRRSRILIGVGITLVATGALLLMFELWGRSLVPMESDFEAMSRDEESDTRDGSEQITGVLLFGNPGMPEGVWQVLRDMPGAPAVMTTLEFLGEAGEGCVADASGILCDGLRYVHGESVTVFGENGEGIFFVNRILRNKGRVSPSHFVGFLRDVRQSDEGEILLSIDPVEWLTGEEARELAAFDTGCPSETIEDCVPSMNNNFYIRNTDQMALDYVLDPGANISLLVSAGSPDLASSSAMLMPERFRTREMMMHLFVYHFERSGQSGLITHILQQYMP